MVTSTRIADAMPTPTIFTMTLGSRAKPVATAIMMAAAALMILAVAARPSATAPRGSPVR